MTPPSEESVVSAPGKVLITGGYLVLDRSYTGVVVGTSSRFFACVRPLSPSNLRPSSSTPFVRRLAETLGVSVERVLGWWAIHADEGGVLWKTGGRPALVVRSPQFLDGLWRYEIDLVGEATGDAQDSSPPNGHKQTEGIFCRLVPVGSKPNRNHYVESTVTYTLSALSSLFGSEAFTERLGAGLEILILGHNDFYSQREQLAKASLPLTSASLASVEPFCPTLTTIGDVHKTGLGSSAAMITSVVGGLLSYFGAVDLPAQKIDVAGKHDETSSGDVSSSSASSVDIQFVHNLAQFTHCLAQGKIGSGFDVSSASFGSHRYRRFSPSVLDGFLDAAQRQLPYLIGDKDFRDDAAPLYPSPSDLLNIVHPSKGTKWDSEVETFHLPPGMIMMLADVDAGSSTPKLVSKVLAWRKEKPEEANKLWMELNAKNRDVEQLLRGLRQRANTHQDVYLLALEKCAKLRASQWQSLLLSTAGLERDVIQEFINVNKTFEEVRAHLRTMSELAGVPIEPAEQTRLLDACLNVPGILMAGVPGAGGYDAIYCVAFSKTAAEQLERDVWNKWTQMNVGPLLARESDGGVVRVK
ncbi:phosphomevalonate kinase [Quaeritorhiza haematococci]|nr:phosphomevalonate kinase [Quaeritorhiza haematococci]